MRRRLVIVAALLATLAAPGLALANRVGGVAIANTGSAAALAHRSPVGTWHKVTNDGVVYVGGGVGD